MRLACLRAQVSHCVRKAVCGDEIGNYGLRIVDCGLRIWTAYPFRHGAGVLLRKNGEYNVTREFRGPRKESYVQLSDAPGLAADVTSSPRATLHDSQCGRVDQARRSDRLCDGRQQ